jgi:hypothetical protein
MIVSTPATRRRALLIGLLLFVSYAYFYQAGGWNQNTRFALVRAILEEHTLRIDTYKDMTGDRALWEGHYYSDKAPGSSLLALAPVELARTSARIAGVDPSSMAGITWTSYVATVATSALFTVIAALCVFWVAQQWGASLAAATFASLAYGLATPAWAYATVFIGHAVTSGCLMLAFAGIIALQRGARRTAAVSWMIGLACGVAVLSEFPAAVPVIVLMLLAIVVLRRDRPEILTSALVHIAAAGALMAVALMAYHAAAFGSPFQLGYGSEDNANGVAMQQGIFGIEGPSWHVVYEVLFGAYRGLLPLAPVIAFAPIGLIPLARKSGARAPVVAGAAIAAGYFLLNVSYHYWEGGWFVGPRHLLPGLAFAAVGLAALWDMGNTAARALLLTATLWGAGAGLVVVSTTPQPPSNVMAPMSELFWPAFREGDLSLNHQRFVDYGANPDRLRHNRPAHASWNLGQLAGLDGLVSLFPLLIVWLAFAAILLL